MKGVVYYQSTQRGIANPDGARPIRYFGKVFRIPASEHGTIRQLEWELSPGDLRSPVHGPEDDEGQAVEAVAGGVIERFEIYDQDSGDVWVMYRVPYAPRET